METRILERSVGKICSLMAVGFGEAGSAIIAANMRTAGALNPLVPGRKARSSQPRQIPRFARPIPIPPWRPNQIVAVFGFCDIRQFTDTTEVLQEGIMAFVNHVAKVVHMQVARFGGSANKNVGDAFLLARARPRKSPANTRI